MFSTPFMSIQEQIRTYLDQEGMIERTDEEIDKIMFDHDEVRAKHVIAALTKGYNGTVSEREFQDAVAQRFDGMIAYDMMKARDQNFLQWMYSKIAKGDLKDASVLDIGCSSGLEACFLAGLARSAVGIDTSTEMIKQARERKARRKQENVEFLVGDRSHLEFPDESFDRTISVNSLITPGEMNMQDADLYYGMAMDDRIGQMHRVLKRHGQAVVIMGVFDYALEYEKDRAEAILKGHKFNIIDRGELTSKWDIIEIYYCGEKS
jgi:SAM-dependent methyltransferase